MVLQQGLHDGTWRVVDPSEQGEVPDVFYVEGRTTQAALRRLAAQIEEDDDRLWNVEGGHYACTLQVVTTRLAPTLPSGRNAASS